MTVARLQAALAQEARRAEKAVREALNDLARIHAYRLNPLGFPASAHVGQGDYDKALGDLSAALARLAASGDLSGRLDVLRPTKNAPKPEDFASRGFDIVPDVVPSVAFEEAIRDLESRDPIGANDLTRAGLEVEDLYRPTVNPSTGEAFYQHGFAAARAVDADIAKRVHEKLVSGLREGKTTPAVVEELVAEWGFPDSYACFLPGSLVEGAFVAGSESRYDGPAVEIETDDGRRLAVTVNHPILTPSGWQSAGSLEKGDDLVCYGSPIKPLDAHASFAPKRVAVDDEHAPARVQDVFEALRMKGSALLDRKRPVHALDFHGDGSFVQGEIHVVGSDCLLGSSQNARVQEMPQQIGLVKCGRATTRSPAVHGGRSKNLLLHSSLHSTPRGMERTEAGGAGALTHGGPSGLARFGLVSNLDPALFKPSDESAVSGSEAYRQLVTSLSGLVSLHRVVNVKRIRWTGHVYDLQTTTGLIVSQGIVSSNCTVVRTNFATATSAGRFVEAERVNRSGLAVVGLMYQAVMDANTRPDHALLDGIVARVDDPFWDSFTPPISWNCRCIASPVFENVPSHFVKPPAGAKATPGFGSRPNRSGLYR